MARREGAVSNTIYAMFEDPSDAERAVGALLDHGLRRQEVSVISSNVGIPSHSRASDGLGDAPPINTEAQARSESIDAESITYASRFAIESGGDAKGQFPLTPTPYETIEGLRVSRETESAAKQGISTTTVHDAEEGALRGTAWGASLGVIASLAAISIPGVGLVIGGGTLAIAMAAAAATAVAGAAVGAVAGFLIDQGVDLDHARGFENSLSQGGTLVSVTVPSGGVDQDEAQMILEKYGSTHMVCRPSRHYVS